MPGEQAREEMEINRGRDRANRRIRQIRFWRMGAMAVDWRKRRRMIGISLTGMDLMIRRTLKIGMYPFHAFQPALCRSSFGR